MIPTDEERKDFYNSKAWRTLRARTVNSWLKHARHCAWCDKPLHRGSRMIVDHTLMIRSHWHLRLDPNNLKVMCHACNSKKAAWVDHNDKEEVDANGYPPSWQ